MSQSSLFLSIYLTTVCLLSTTLSSLAETRFIPKPLDTPLDLDLLENPNGSVITAKTIYQEQITIPSLWWAQENSQKKLLDNWIAYPAKENQSARVDLIVNQQIWSLLDYLERYNFVNRLGSVARSYGYNIRVFNYQKERLATYTCNFSFNPALCRIEMSSQNQFGLRRSFSEESMVNGQ